jgi:hypothetical protein
MFSDYLANKILDHVTGVAAYTAPTQIKVALFTARGSTAQACAGTNFTEVSGGSYAQVNVGIGTTNWNTAAARLVDNKLAVALGTATADWGTVTCIGYYDQTGNLLWWGDITSRNITNGAVVSMAAGVIDVSFPQS